MNITEFLNPRHEDSLFDIIIPNAACNMKCKYCYGEHSINIRNDCHVKLDEIALDKALAHIPKDKIGGITIWGGEPLFNKTQIEDTVTYIKDRFPKGHINMMVNGSLLNDYWTKFIIDNQIVIGISHDGPGQKYRGEDYLENQEICNNIIALRKEKLFFSFNSVFHRLSPLVKDIHEYFMKKEDKLKVGLGVSPRLVRYIGTASEPFLFRKEDYHYLNENAEYIVNYIFKALLDNNPIAIDKNLGEPIKELFVRIINKLGNNPLPFIKNQPSCGTLFATKVAISGERVFCNGVTEGGDLTKAKNLLTNYKSWDKCDTCETNTLCQGICAALTEAQLEKNCNTFKYFYNKVEELIKKVYYNS